MIDLCIYVIIKARSRREPAMKTISRLFGALDYPGHFLYIWLNSIDLLTPAKMLSNTIKTQKSPTDPSPNSNRWSYHKTPTQWGYLLYPYCTTTKEVLQ
nr:MAG TPA: hypothetical protein [Caudoviricetes sp.]